MLYIITKYVSFIKDSTGYRINGVPEHSILEGFMSLWAMIFMIVGLVVLLLLSVLIIGLIKHKTVVSRASGASILGLLGITALVYRLESRRFSKYLLKK